MPTLDIRTFETYDGFAAEWHEETLADTDVTLEEARERGLLNEQGTRQLWQLLGLLDDDELVIQLPEWLAAEKVGSSDHTTPTLFVGRVARETEKAALFEDTAAAQPLMALAHRIHSVEDGLSNTDDEDRRSGLERRLQETKRAFMAREGTVGLRDEWVPKSQIRVAVRRRPSATDRP